MIRKIYKNHRLEFRQDKHSNYLYRGYKEDGELFEEMVEGWGWTITSFSLEQLEKLADW